MTSRLLDAIKAYYSNPGGYNLERGMDLIAEGHLSVREVEAVERALRRYREKVAMST